VLRFYGYFKESVVESRFENYKIRKLIILYHLEDHSIMISEPRQVNSGTPQGVFLKRQMVLKQDGSGLPMLPNDFRIGLDVGILGRSVRIYDCDQYTREFFETQGIYQGEPQSVPIDSYAEKQIPKPILRDPSLKEYMEKSLGGGRVKCQKQFLDNDRRVLRFFARFDDLPFIIHYFLADDTVEIREVHHPNDGRDNFALLMKRQRLPVDFKMAQPGLMYMGDNYFTWDQIQPNGFIESFGR
jgi:hypothetical protein